MDQHPPQQDLGGQPHPFPMAVLQLLPAALLLLVGPVAHEPAASAALIAAPSSRSHSTSQPRNSNTASTNGRPASTPGASRSPPANGSGATCDDAGAARRSLSHASRHVWLRVAAAARGRGSGTAAAAPRARGSRAARRPPGPRAPRARPLGPERIGRDNRRGDPAHAPHAFRAGIITHDGCASRAISRLISRLISPQVRPLKSYTLHLYVGSWERSWLFLLPPLPIGRPLYFLKVVFEF